jgi:carbon-monoxide dehydrogenase medium subunit
MRDIGAVRLYRPSDEAQALRVLSSAGAHPVIVAGATDLCAQFNEGLQVSDLVSLSRVDGYRDIRATDGGVTIGAGCTHALGAHDPVLAALCPDLQIAWRSVAAGILRVRAWATIGGNLMARKPRYEMSILLTALAASLRFCTTTGPSCIAAEDLWSGPAPGQGFLWQVEVPTRQLVALRYDRSLRPLMTLATSCRLVADGVRARAVIATQELQPQVLDLDLVESCAAYVRDARDHAIEAFSALPTDFSDGQSSNDYLRRVGAVLLRRHLESLAHV